MGDTFVLADDAHPTTDEVHQALRDGKLPREKHTFGAATMLTALNQMTAAVHKNSTVMVAKGYPQTPQRLVEAHRLAHLGGVLGAERIEKSINTQEATLAQVGPRQVLIRNRDACKQLARDAGAKVDHFPVKFPAGDANALVGPANTLVQLIAKYKDKLGNPILAAEIEEEVRAAAKELRDAETRQEVSKVDQTIPTAVKAYASEALYASLLHFSRAGGAVFRNQPDIAATFQLNVLFRRASSGSGEEGVTAVTEGGDGEEGEVTPTPPPTKPDPPKDAVTG